MIWFVWLALFRLEGREGPWYYKFPACFWEQQVEEPQQSSWFPKKNTGYPAVSPYSNWESLCSAGALPERGAHGSQPCGTITGFQVVGAKTDPMSRLLIAEPGPVQPPEQKALRMIGPECIGKFHLLASFF